MGGWLEGWGWANGLVVFEWVDSRGREVGPDGKRSKFEFSISFLSKGGTQWAWYQDIKVGKVGRLEDHAAILI